MILKPPVDDPVEKTKGLLKGKTSLLKLLLEERKKEADTFRSSPNSFK